MPGSVAPAWAIGYVHPRIAVKSAGISPVFRFIKRSMILHGQPPIIPALPWRIARAK
jgi:hypothetical protein